MTIRDIIVRYSKELEEISSTPRLDVETLLQKVLNVDRLYILLNLDKSLNEEEENLFNKFIARDKSHAVVFFTNSPCLKLAST